MLNQPLIATAILMGLLVIGEIISIATRARVPMLLVVFLGYMLALWTGLFPKDIVTNSPLSTFGSLVIAPLIVHMGTLMPMQIIRKQYKAVVIALSGILIAGVLVIAIVTPIMGYETAVSGVGPLTGGIIAFLITSEKLKALGLTSLVVIPALVLALQKLLGLPLATNLLRRYATKMVAQPEFAELVHESHKEKTTEKKKRCLIKEKYSTPIVLLFQLMFGGALAVILGEFTPIHYSLWALTIGILGMYSGFYQENMMVRANSFGIAMAGLIFVIVPSLNEVTFQKFVEYLPMVFLILGLGAVGIALGGYIASKLLKWDPMLGIPVALTALFGFPGDYIICEEISRSTGKNGAEEKYIFNQLMSPLLIGGFTTVTTASIVVASMLMSTL
ncbi:hypothetical protein [Thalassobacillus hwangdonensis]|uniref:Integral membrane protein n=1 Tax=Thalassobacillus hwangdonensis TaxID=546108 RepID=A0ABW3KW73_9BACI